MKAPGFLKLANFPPILLFSVKKFFETCFSAQMLHFEVVRRHCQRLEQRNSWHYTTAQILVPSPAICRMSCVAVCWILAPSMGRLRHCSFSNQSSYVAVSGIDIFVQDPSTGCRRWPETSCACANELRMRRTLWQRLSCSRSTPSSPSTSYSKIRIRKKSPKMKWGKCFSIYYFILAKI